jgi:hypothetical protein
MAIPVGTPLLDHFAALADPASGELKLQERHHTNALKDNIVLKQQLAQTRAKRR